VFTRGVEWLGGKAIQKGDGRRSRGRIWGVKKSGIKKTLRGLYCEVQGGWAGLKGGIFVCKVQAVPGKSAKKKQGYEAINKKFGGGEGSQRNRKTQVRFWRGDRREGETNKGGGGTWIEGTKPEEI